MDRRDFDRFVRKQIVAHNQELSPKQAALQDCHEVTSVVSGSPASMLGIGVGDHVFQADGRPSASLGPNFEAKSRHPSRYEVVSADGARAFAFETTGIDAGMRVQRTPDAIVKYGRRSGGIAETEELTILWNMEAWLRLEQLTRPRWTDRLNPLRWWGGSYPPISLLHGAAHFEAGDAQAGLRKLSNFIEHHLSDYTSAISSIGVYYMAVLSLQAGDEEQGRHWIEQAWEIWPHPRIGRAFDSIVGNPPPSHQPALVGETFPHMYSLATLDDETGSVELVRALEQVEEGCVLMVWAMLGWRANGPYDELMKSYRRWQRLYGAWLAGVHVLTTNENRGGFASLWLENEDAARAEGLPVTVVHDTAGINDALEIRGAPYVFFLDRKGRVLHTAVDPTGNDIWTALAVANGRVDLSPEGV